MVAEFVYDIETLLLNPYSLLFLSLFGVGYFLKEHTKFPNKLIPIALILIGVGLAILLLGFSLTAILVGFSISSIIMANYETIRHTIDYYFSTKRDNNNDFPDADD